MKIERFFLKVLRMIFYTITIIFILLNTVDAIGPIKFIHNGHWYESFGGPDFCQTWIEARDYAANSTYVDPDTEILLQGHLVTIQDIAENEFVRSNLISGPYKQMWIGAFQFSHDDELADNWAWVTGEEWDYTNWDLDLDQPNSYEEDYGRLLNFFWGKWHDFPNEVSSCGNLYTVIEYEPPIYSCSGFEPPMDKTVTAKKKNRALPLKAELFNAGGMLLTDSDLIALPVIQIVYQGGIEEDPEVVPDELLAVGKGTEGNEFEFTGSKWQFNLELKNFTASGTYTVTMVPGGPSYLIIPTCEATFVIE